MPVILVVRLMFVLRGNFQAYLIRVCHLRGRFCFVIIFSELNNKRRNHHEIETIWQCFCLSISKDREHLKWREDESVRSKNKTSCIYLIINSKTWSVVLNRCCHVSLLNLEIKKLKIPLKTHLVVSKLLLYHTGKDNNTLIKIIR